MNYLPNTEQDYKEMLAAIGVKSFDELVKEVPASLREKKMKIPPGMSEPEVLKLMAQLSGKNKDGQGVLNFIGAGAYEHYIPTVVNHLAGRSEFYTAYTPYQPEASQGTLQAIFEYQTLMAELTGLDVSNASLYEGASAVVEGVTAAFNSFHDRYEFLIAGTLHPEYLQTVKTTLHGLPFTFKTIPRAKGSGTLDLAFIEKNLTEKVAGVIVQSPNFFGSIEPMDKICELAKKTHTIFVSVVNPISLGVLEAPGEYGAHVAVGEGQPLGNPLSYGGPYLGFFVAKEELMRKVPGRIVGMTKDKEGRRAFVLTLQAREQHIRREKAVSNICTNQSLLALRAAIYLCSIGREGIKEVGRQNILKAHYAKEEIVKLKGYKIKFNEPFFNEFVVECPKPAKEIQKILMEKGILAGLPLGCLDPEMGRSLLVCVTETKSKAEIDTLVKQLKGA